MAEIEVIQQLFISQSPEELAETNSKQYRTLFEHPYDKNTTNKQPFKSLPSSAKYARRSQQNASRRNNLTPQHNRFYNWFAALVKRTGCTTGKQFADLYLDDLLASPTQMVYRYLNRSGILPRKAVMHRLRMLDWELELNYIKFQDLPIDATFYTEQDNREWIKTSNTEAICTRGVREYLPFKEDFIVMKLLKSELAIILKTEVNS